MLRPPTKPQCGGQCGGRCPCGQGRTFWGPNFPKICPRPGRGCEKIRGRSPTALPPKNTTFGHIGMPLYSLARRGGACQHGRILGGRAGGGTHGLGGSPKAPPPVGPLPTHIGAGLTCIIVVSGVPCWLASLGAGRAHGDGCRPTSDTRHHARAHPLGSLRRLALGLDRLRCAYARPSCRPVGAARPPYPGFAPRPFYGGLLFKIPYIKPSTPLNHLN